MEKLAKQRWFTGFEPKEKAQVFEKNYPTGRLMLDDAIDTSIELLNLMEQYSVPDLPSLETMLKANAEA